MKTDNIRKKYAMDADDDFYSWANGKSGTKDCVVKWTGVTESGGKFPASINLPKCKSAEDAINKACAKLKSSKGFIGGNLELTLYVLPQMRVVARNNRGTVGRGLNMEKPKPLRDASKPQSWFQH